MRTVIYARYSSQLQNSRSIEDQVRVCAERATAEGWDVLDVFSDAAIGGAAGMGERQRPGMNALLARVERGGVDQVLADSTSRIARNQGDAHHIRDRLNYHGARLFTLGDGEIDAFKGAIKGLLDEQGRKELAHNIKRAQRGRVAEGRSPAGLAYGYRLANRIDDRGRFVRGLREIVPDQADVVRRIFAEYRAGASPRAIAKALNAENVPGPRGGTWRGSTIGGDAKRRNGILRNQLYHGVLVHFRTSKLVEPQSRCVRIRPNAEDSWVSGDAEALRIVDAETWNAVQELLASREGPSPERRRRPKHMLSGLAVCGLCGGGWTVIGRGRWGCGRTRDGGGCTNGRTINTELMEARVLAGLQDLLLDPELVGEVVREYRQEHARRMTEITRGRAKLERRHADAATRVARLVEAVAGGAGDFQEFRSALQSARTERDRLAAEMAEAEAYRVVTLHPGIADKYRRLVESLNEALADPESGREVIPILRDLIERVEVTPAKIGRGVEIAVTGKLRNLLALATGAAPAVVQDADVCLRGSG